MKVLLDEEFYEAGYDNLYFDTLVHIILKYTSYNFVAFYPNSNKGKFLNLRNKIIFGMQRIQKAKRLLIYDSTEVIDVEMQASLELSKRFCGQIQFLNKIDSVLLALCPNKFKYDVKVLCDNVVCLNDVLCEVNSFIAELAENSFLQNLLPPTKTEPLPNSELCTSYYYVQQSLLTYSHDKHNVYKSVGKEVARRNGYSYNALVSNKNNAFGHRDIYDYKGVVYVSVDFESGCFEAHDQRGKHLGEFAYTGTKLHDADKSGRHDIRV